MTERVCLAVIARARPSYETFACAMAACAYDPRGNLALPAPCEFSVAEARNNAVRLFRAGRTGSENFTRFMMVDGDISFPPDTVTRMLEVDAPIVTGCVPNVMGRFGLEVPTVMVARVRDDGSEDWHYRWFTDTLDAPYCGCGCVMIKPEVFEKLGFPWFQWPESEEGDSGLRGEDVDFTRRAVAAGFGIKAIGTLRCGHRKKTDVAAQIVEEGERPHTISWNGPKTLEQMTTIPPNQSHLESLQQLPALTTVKKVIQYGANLAALNTFLDRDIYKDLEELICLDDDSHRASMLKELLPDPRFSARYCHLETMPEVAAQLNGADVVVIDCDSDNVDYKERCILIKHYEDSDSIVVVHDSEEKAIAAAVVPAKYKYKKVHQLRKLPWTTTMSNKVDVNKMELV